MEEKKKTNQTSKKKTTTTKKVAAKKTTTAKKTTAKKAPAKKATAPKKVAAKAPAKKKVAPKKVEKPVEPKVEVEPVKEEAKLEKTIIFDGKQKQNLKEVVEKLETENVVVEDKVIKRSAFKRIAIVVIAIAMVVIAAASAGYVISQKETEKRNNQTLNSNVYEKVKENKENKKVPELDKTKEVEANSDYSNIETLNLAQFEDLVVTKKNMVVLVASSTCYGCITFEPVVNEVFKEKNQTVYRLDVISLSKDELTRFRTYYAFTVTPTLFVIKDGVVVADTARTGAMSKADLTKWVNENV